MNSTLERLVDYPFERKRVLLAGLTPPNPIDCTIGEPQHTPPLFIAESLRRHLDAGLAKYPPTKQDPQFSEAITAWASQNLGIALSEEQILALAGTGEGLYSIPFVALDPSGRRNIALIPNPFYQVYEGGTIMAGGEPHYFNLLPPQNFQPDFKSLVPGLLDRVGLLYLNYPNNPTGANATEETLRQAVQMAQDKDIIVVSDECYFDIYFGQKPRSILQVAKEMGVLDYHNLLAFHSLSKRSSVPGLRSGFMAGDANIISKYLRVRMLERKAVPLQVQLASVEAWKDDVHVDQNRGLYAAKVDDFCRILSRTLKPEGTFFVWFKVPDGFTSERFTRELYKEQGVAVLPGNYLSREVGRINPGEGYVRIALVHSRERSQEAAERIQRFIGGR